MRSSHRSYIAGALAAGLAALAAGCARHAAPAPALRAMPVVVQPVRWTPVSQTTQYVATLLSRQTATLYPQVTGYIRQIRVHSGDRVRAGQLLMMVDPLKQQATVKSQSEALRAQAALLSYDRQQLRRAEALWRAKVVSRQDVEQARSTYANARAQLAALRAQLRAQRVQLRYYDIVAPRAGIVGDIPVHVGDLVSNATPLTTVVQPGNLEAYIYVPVERARQLRPGLAVQLVNANGRVLATSRIRFISPQVDATAQTVLVKAVFGDEGGGLRNQQYVKARIVWGTRPAILAPVLDISQINGRQFAFIAAPGPRGFVARQVLLTVGAIVGNNYVVKSGLRPGDRLIVSDTQFLVSGMPVVPLPPRPPAAAARRGK